MPSKINAGIIVYRETKLPQLLSMLAPPKTADNILISNDLQDIDIHIFDCPVNGVKLDKKRYRQLKELVDKNKIKFLVERFEAKVQSNVTPKKNELHYSRLLEEISSIKQFAALLKLCQAKQENLLAGSIGFILGRIDSLKIDILSEEASNIMLYEGADLTEEIKARLHNSFMEKKGISIIFTRSIKDIIEKSSVILIDEFIDLNDHVEALKDKTVLGRNNTKGLKSIDNIILWTEELKNRGCDTSPVALNDEILAVVRYYNMKLDIIDFIKRLPYIYLD